MTKFIYLQIYHSGSTALEHHIESTRLNNTYKRIHDYYFSLNLQICFFLPAKQFSSFQSLRFHCNASTVAQCSHLMDIYTEKKYRRFRIHDNSHASIFDGAVAATVRHIRDGRRTRIPSPSITTIFRVSSIHSAIRHQ